MNSEISSEEKSLKTKGSYFNSYTNTAPNTFQPIIGKPYNIDKLSLQQIDNLQITYIFTTGRSASTLLGAMLMMHEQALLTSEEVFPIVLKQKYQHIRSWTEQTIKEYCNDFVLMSEGKLYPLFCGKDVLYELLIKFKAHLNYERVIRLSYLAFGVNKDLSKITTIVDKQLRYYLSENYLKLFPNAKILLLVRDPRDNVFSKYNRAKRKKIKPATCIYIQTWKAAFSTYLKLLKKHNSNFLIVNYEKLINDSVNTMKQISDYLSLPYTDNYFNYHEITKSFFDTISYPELYDNLIIIHKSLTQPITPQKVNEWQDQMNNPEIARIINATWLETKNIAHPFHYTSHNNYSPHKINCFKALLSVKYNFITSYLYFHCFPYFLKKLIKKTKYPYRKNAVTSYDIFLRQGYL